MMRDWLSYDPTTGIFTWRVSTRGRKRAGAVAGYTDPRGYVHIRIDCTRYYAHRLAWLYTYGQWPDGDIDHKDGDRGNNRIANLRLATPSQNGGNSRRHRDNQTGFKGVMFHGPTGRYHARIMVNRKSTHLGYYDTPDLAHAAYVEAAIKYRGSFARSQ